MKNSKITTVSMQEKEKGAFAPITQFNLSSWCAFTLALFEACLKDVKVKLFMMRAFSYF